MLILLPRYLLESQKSPDIIREVGSANSPALVLQTRRPFYLGPGPVSFQDRQLRAAKVLLLIAPRTSQMRERECHRSISDLVNEQMHEDVAAGSVVDSIVSGELHFLRQLEGEIIELTVQFRMDNACSRNPRPDQLTANDDPALHRRNGQTLVEFGTDGSLQDAQRNDI